MNVHDLFFLNLAPALIHALIAFHLRTFLSHLSTLLRSLILVLLSFLTLRLFSFAYALRVEFLATAHPVYQLVVILASLFRVTS